MSTHSVKSPQRRSVAHRALTAQLIDRVEAAGERLTVIDLGGGTGGVAVLLAQAGHQVMVIDPSPDALAATARRAAEAGLADRLTAGQGDTTTLDEMVDPASVDVLLCHMVLERRADATAALTAIARALRPGGLVSIVIAQRFAMALQRATLGQIGAASDLLADRELLDAPALREELAAAGFTIDSEFAVGLISDHVGEDAAEGRRDELLLLERAAAQNPAWIETAPKIHVLARRE